MTMCRGGVFAGALVALGALCGGRVAAAHDAGVRPEASFERVIRRLSIRTGIAAPSAFAMQPAPAGALIAFIDSALADSGVLTDLEMREARAARASIDGSRRLARWRSPDGAVHSFVNLSLLGDIRPAWSDSFTLGLRGVIRPRLSVAAGDFSFYSSLDVWTDYRSDTAWTPSSYQPFDGVPYNLYGRADTGSVRSSDVFRGGVLWRHEPFLFETAVDYLRQGPAVFYPLTFSGGTPPVTYARGRFDMGPLQYTHTVGQLKSQRDKPKYLYTHRLQFTLWQSRITGAISEVIINGSTAELAQSDSLRRDYYDVERGWEWVYMIPFIPFSFAEHYVGDRDNAALSFDLALRYPRGWRWYAELFLDDVTPALWSDDWGNKWAITVGGEFFGAWAGRSVHAVAEYCRIEPWVYTHFYGGSHRYTHFDKSLGAGQGPNADALRLQGTAALTSLHEAGIAYDLTRKGSSRGSDIRDVYQDFIDPETKAFLAGDVSVEQSLAALWRFNRFGLFAVDAELGYRFSVGPYVVCEGGFSF